MGGGQPYIYTTPVTRDSGIDFDYNPRAYSQATYAASSEKSSPRRTQDGPLVSFNRHPDSWTVTQNEKTIDPLPASMRSKVVSVRWTQFGLRIAQLLIDLGLIACAILIQGAGSALEWVIRIPPIWDAIINTYAIYNLFRPASERPVGSTLAYTFFAFSMDCALVPFYVYIGYCSHAESIESSGTSGRWTTLFSLDTATEIILEVTWVVAFVLAGLHVVSVVLDVLLLLWFRKISKQPPDVNPLEGTRRQRSADGSSADLKAGYRISTASISTSASIPPGYSIPALDHREVPFFQSRVDADSRWSHSTLAPARASPVQHPGSLASPTHSNYAPSSGHSSPTRESYTDRYSTTQSAENLKLLPRPLQTNRNSGQRDLPRAPYGQHHTAQTQDQSLLRKNSWEAYDDEVDIGTSRTQSPAPPIPQKSDSRYLSPYRTDENDAIAGSGGVRRMTTISSSVYSGDDAASVASTSTVRGPKTYGLLSTAQQAVRYDRGSRVQSPERPAHSSNRNPSTGVDLADVAVYDAPRQRNFSWKVAEEGRGQGRYSQGNWL